VPVLLLLLVLILAAILLSVVLIPFTLVQRYRMGTARRRAWPWLATVNVLGLTISLMLFFVGAAFTNVWVPQALLYSALGAGAGVAIGLVGLVLTRWEQVPGALFYTPNRWLVLAVTLAVAGRLLYGAWRGWHAWNGAYSDPLLVGSGTAGTLAAGALILGYYLMFWLGVRHRAQSWNRD
jgi:hypothetical protein